MTYTRDVPQATDRIADTQVPIKDNFNLVDSDFGVDHYSPSALSNQASPGSNIGYHYKVTLPKLASNATAPANSGVAFTKQQSSQTLAYYSRDGAAQGYPIVPVRAAGAVTISGGTPTFQELFNCTVAKSGTGLYQVTFTDPTEFKLNSGYYYMPIITSGSSTTPNPRFANYQAVLTTGFQIRLCDSGGSPADSIGFSFIVIQF